MMAGFVDQDRLLEATTRTSSSWTCRIQDNQVYLNSAVHGEDCPVDFRVISQRDVSAATAYFRRAIESQGSLHGPSRTVTRHLIAPCAT